jgi:hypothetical protein
MSIEKLLDLSRQKLTEEELMERQKRFEEMLRQNDLENIERNRCGYCGVDTVNYSHAFSCPRRGFC